MVSRSQVMGKMVPIREVNKSGDINTKITGDTIMCNLSQLKTNSLKLDTAKPLILMGTPSQVNVDKPDKKIDTIIWQGESIKKIIAPEKINNGAVDIVSKLQTLVSGLVVTTKKPKIEPMVILPWKNIITGKVTDEKGQPLAYASVTVKNKNYGTTTDSAGYFSLHMYEEDRSEATIIASYIGFESKDIALIGGKETITNISLNKKDMKLPDVQICSSQTTRIGMTLGAVSIRTTYKTNAIDTLIRRVLGTQAFTIYPNPVARGGSVNISVKNPGEYSIQLIDNNSRIIQVLIAAAYSKQQSIQMALPSNVAAGYYYIRLVDEKTKKQYVDKVLIH